MENNQNVLFFRHSHNITTFEGGDRTAIKKSLSGRKQRLAATGYTHRVTAKRSKRLTKRLLFRLTDDDGHCKSANGSGASETGRRRW